MKRKIAILLASVMVIGALTACGGDGGTNTPAAGDQTPAEDQAAPGDEEPAGDEAPADSQEGAASGDVNWDDIEPIELIVSSTKTEAADAALVAFTDRITERTQGKVTFSFFWGGSLVKANEVVDALQVGTCDMAQVNYSNFENLFPMNCNVLAVPFMGMTTETTEVYEQLLAAHPELQAELDNNGVHLCGYSMTAPYNLYINSSTEIKAPEDLSGKKVICLQMNVMEFLTSINCAPVQAAFSDFFTSIQGGVADGIITHGGPINQQGITDEINQEIIFGENSGLYVETVAYCMSKSKWESLPAEVQQVFEEEAAGLHADDQEVMNNHNAIQKKAAEDAGHRYWEMTEEELQPWKDAMAPFIQAKLDEIAALPGCESFMEIYEDALSMIEAAK